MDMGGSMFDRLEVETPMCPKSFELAMLGLETDTGMVIKPQNEPKHIAVASAERTRLGRSRALRQYEHFPRVQHHGVADMFSSAETAIHRKLDAT